VTSKKAGDVDNMQQRRREGSPLAAERGHGLRSQAKCTAMGQREVQGDMQKTASQPRGGNRNGLGRRCHSRHAHRRTTGRIIKNRDVREVREDAAEGAGACQNKNNRGAPWWGAAV
jgi:hypothetical protein